MALIVIDPRLRLLYWVCVVVPVELCVGAAVGVDVDAPFAAVGAGVDDVLPVVELLVPLPAVVDDVLGAAAVDDPPLVLEPVLAVAAVGPVVAAGACGWSQLGSVVGSKPGSDNRLATFAALSSEPDPFSATSPATFRTWDRLFHDALFQETLFHDALFQEALFHDALFQETLFHEALSQDALS